MNKLTNREKVLLVVCSIFMVFYLVFPLIASTVFVDAQQSKKEDAAHTSGDFGFQTLTVRQASAAALAGSNGDYQPLITDTTGQLYVTTGSNAVVLNATKAEDSAHTSTDHVFPMGVVRKNTATALSDDGDYTLLETDTNGKLYTNTGLLQYAEDAGHTSGDYLFPVVVRKDTAAALGTDGDYTLLETDANGKLWVNTALTDQVQVTEDDALASATKGNVALVLRADSAASSGAAGDAVYLISDANGRLYVNAAITELKTLNAGGTFVVSVTQANASQAITAGRDLRIVCDQDGDEVFYNLGNTATTSDAYLPPGVIEYVPNQTASTIQMIAAAGETNTCYVSERY